MVLVLEHCFRRGRYDVENWNNPDRLPMGWATIAVMVFELFGVYLGAAQSTFVGPIASLFSPSFGMDIGFELGVLFAAIAYLILRPIEL